MLTKAQIKHIQSLDDKKYRHEHQQFVIEGLKSIVEILEAGIQPKSLYISKSLQEQQYIQAECEVLEDFNFAKISAQKKPEGILAILDMPSHGLPGDGLTKAIVLDNIKDPGNMGTILRTADWFGIQHIICSNQSVDAYNRKCIQSSMGSILRLKVHYTELNEFLKGYQGMKIAAVLGGTDYKEFKSTKEGILIIGSESQGISKNILNLCDQKISILGQGQAESLNAAIACGILVSSIFE